MSENNTYLKYLKYKNKYLELKKLNDQLTNVEQLGGEKRRVKTISNTGAREGMYMQCFWISILDYLRGHGHPQLTLRQLRHEAGLGANTENMMFDIDYSVNEQAVFYNAATKIAELYDLRIKIYTATRMGDFVLTDSQRGDIGEGEHQVELAQFGIGHFELIDAVNGSDFIPAVVVKGNLTKVTEINPEIKESYLRLSEEQSMLKILRDHLKVNEIVYEKQLKIKNELTVSTEFTVDQKAIFLKHHDTVLNKIVLEINAIEIKIRQLEEDILSLKLIIKEFETSN